MPPLCVRACVRARLGDNNAAIRCLINDLFIKAPVNEQSNISCVFGVSRMAAE